MFENLKIQWQIIIGQTLLCTFIISLLWISTYYFFEYFMNFLKSSSNSILNRQLVNSSQSVFTEIQYALKQDFEVLRRQLDTLSMVYLYNKYNKPIFKEDVEPVLNSFSQSYPIQYTSSFSYGLFGNDTQSDYADLLSLSDTLTTFYVSNEQYSFYFTGIGQEQYYSINHGDPYGSYQPHSRGWYQKQIANTSSQFLFSEPYSSYFGGVYMTETSMIRDIDELRAISAIDINMTGFGDLNQQMDFLEVIVTTRSGLLAICNYYQNGLQQVDYIYNQTITGFNQSDFQQMYNLANHINITNTCNVQLNNTVCLVDNHGSEFNFMAAFQSDPDLIVIAKIESTIYTTPLETLIAQFQNHWNQLVLQLIITLNIVIGVNIVASLILDYLVFQPIKQLRLFTSNLYYKDIQCRKLKLNSSCPEITDLNHAFYDFINQSKQDPMKLQKYMVIKQDYPKGRHYLSYNIHQMIPRLRNYDYLMDEYSYTKQDRCNTNDILFTMMKQLS